MNICSEYLSERAGLHITVSIMSACRSMGSKIESQLGHITSIKIDREIISMVILQLLLIQEEQLSVTGESVYLKNWLTAQRTEPAQEKCE